MSPGAASRRVPLYPVLLLLAASFSGCGLRDPDIESSGLPGTTQIVFEVISDEEHFGHNINEEGLHTVWIDGVRTRTAGAGKPMVIYWVNNQIAEMGYRFESGKTYTVTYRGEVLDGVMGYEGDCLDVGQIVGVEYPEDIAPRPQESRIPEPP